MLWCLKKNNFSLINSVKQLDSFIITSHPLDTLWTNTHGNRKSFFSFLSHSNKYTILSQGYPLAGGEVVCILALCLHCYIICLHSDRNQRPPGIPLKLCLLCNFWLCGSFSFHGKELTLSYEAGNWLMYLSIQASNVLITSLVTLPSSDVSG